MEVQDQVIGRLSNMTLGGQSILLRFYEKILNEDREQIRSMELTYFAHSVTSLFYLQYSEQQNKKALLDTATIKVLSESIQSAREGLSIEQAKKEYEDRLSEYSKLIVDLLDEGNEDNPIVPLFIQFYEHTMQKSSEDEIFDFSKVGRILSRYIIDNIRYARKTFPAEAK